MRVALADVMRQPDCFIAALGAIPVQGCVPSQIGGIATDSREVMAGDLFVALCGVRQNGAHFVNEALARGAAAVLCDADAEVASGEYSLLRVLDCKEALLSAAAVRRRTARATVIAISGSAGKTTVKELLATMLGEVGTVEKSNGNYNSTLGMPLSLLGMQEADYFVLEIGINHKGEMEPLARTLAPDIAVLTNVGTAHIGQYGDFSTLLGEKLKLSCGLDEKGVLFVPDSIPQAVLGGVGANVLRFGASTGSDVRVSRAFSHSMGVTADICTEKRAIHALSWHIPGSIGISCLAIAAGVGAHLGVSDEAIRRGVAKARVSSPRMHRIEVDGHILIDDTYNASPEAVVASIESLCYLSGNNPRAAVLGDMGELGDQAAALHRAVGSCAAHAGLLQLFLYGMHANDLAEGALAAGMPDHRVHIFFVGQEVALATALMTNTPQGTYVLLKASRSTALERVIEALRRER